MCGGMTLARTHDHAIVCRVAAKQSLQVCTMGEEPSTHQEHGNASMLTCRQDCGQAVHSPGSTSPTNAYKREKFQRAE